MSYWIHPEAAVELGEAADYYAEHANPTIAQAFIAEFERVRDLLIKNQGRGPFGEFGFRIYHIDRFPYTVVYDQDDQAGPQIYAVAHQHREPGYWRARA